MNNKNNKGQGLVEFALTLPILLLLLLGIIEASRIIWAQITVQAAARDAARYAVTGKPYVLPKNLGLKSDPSNPDAACAKPEGEEALGAQDPWLCTADARANAIKNFATQSAKWLAGANGDIEELKCPASLMPPVDKYDPNWNCHGKAGVFGVQVVGQKIDPSLSSTGSTTQTVDVPNFAGTQGLNVLISTFYNVKMIDPLFDAVMGFIPVTVRGVSGMQNEGIDTAMGSIPPPTIKITKVISGVNPYGSPNKGQRIYSASGPGPFANDVAVNIVLEEHAQLLGPYDIYLQTLSTEPGTIVRQYRICRNTKTNSSNYAMEACELNSENEIPTGSYCLYSVFAGSTGHNCDVNPQAAQKDPPLVIADTGDPRIVTTDSGGSSSIWAARSKIEVGLLSHKDPPFDVYLKYGPNEDLIAINQNTVNGMAVIIWKVPPESETDTSPCPRGGAPCIIESRQTISGSTMYAQKEIYITEPQIEFVGQTAPMPTFVGGNSVRYELRDHTPNRKYDVVVRQILSGTSQVVYHGSLLDSVDSNGNSDVLAIAIPAGADGWPNGKYEIGTYSVGVAESDLDIDWIAPRKFFEIQTTTNPYLTIDGDIYEWPINSCINIKLYQHIPGLHFLQFGPWTVPVKNSTNNLFSVDAQGMAVQEYCIPATTPTGSYEIKSFREGDNPTADAPQATILVKVLSTPLIQVFKDGTMVPDGGSVLPKDIVTIKLINHAPLSLYRVVYAEKEIEKSVQTDQNGLVEFQYDFSFLPRTPAPDPLNPLGVIYAMASQENFGNKQRVATTTLAFKSVDLQVTRIDLPAGWSSALQETKKGGQDTDYINKPITLTFYVKNLDATIPISRYFDTDLYHNPSPFAPAYRPNSTALNFPGYYKYWESYVAPGNEFPIVQPFTLNKYGKHTFYGYGDTSNFIFEGNEVNNVFSTTINLTCGAPPDTRQITFTEPPLEPKTGENTFDTVDNIANWTGWAFGTSHGSASISKGQLVLNHTNGKINSVVDTFYTYYQNDSVPYLQSIQIDIIKPPKPISGGTKDAKAGIELRSIGPADAAKGQNWSKRVYMAVDLKPTADYKIVAGWRTDNTHMDQKDSGSTRVKSDGFPVSLRITRDPVTGNIFRFSYKPKGSTWQDFPYQFDVPMPNTLYISLFGTNEDSNTDSSQYSQSTFDNLSYNYNTRSMVQFNQWKNQVYGSDTFGDVNKNAPEPDIKGKNLVLKNSGEDSLMRNDDTDSTGYFFFERVDPPTVTTESSFEVMAGIHSISDTNNTVGGMAGLELRNSLDGRSGKIQFGLLRKADGKYTPYAVQRPQNGVEKALAFNEGVKLDGNQDVWLRITRDDGTDTYRFYYQLGGTSFPSSWTSYGEATVSGMENIVKPGLFNVSYKKDAFQEVQFSGFKLSFRDCAAGSTMLEAGQVGPDGVPVNPPPGLQLCPNPIEDSGFEVPGTWASGGQAYRQPGTGHLSSNYKMSAPTYNQNNPFFYQEFIMPEWIMSSTTKLKLNFYKNVDNRADFYPPGTPSNIINDKNDIFRAAIATQPPSLIAMDGEPSDATLITAKTAIADGDWSATKYSPSDWRPGSVELPLLVNPEDYIGQKLYLIVYNSSNGANCALYDSCHKTGFFFDDMELSTCTTNPAPTTFSSRLQGKVTLFIPNEDGTTTESRVTGVEVWAYAENGKLYKTTTIQGGEYNFYDLPVGQYYIYAEYPINKGNDVIMLAEDKIVDISGGQMLNFNLSLFDIGLY